MAVKVCKGGERRCDAGYGCLGMAAHVEERNGKFKLGCLGRALYGAVWRCSSGLLRLGDVSPGVDRYGSQGLSRHCEVR